MHQPHALPSARRCYANKPPLNASCILFANLPRTKLQEERLAGLGAPLKPRFDGFLANSHLQAFVLSFAILLGMPALLIRAGRDAGRPMAKSWSYSVDIAPLSIEHGPPAYAKPRCGIRQPSQMAGASSDFFDAVQRYPVMLLDRERIFGRLEDNTRTQIARPEKYVAPDFVRFRVAVYPAAEPSETRRFVLSDRRIPPG